MNIARKSSRKYFSRFAFARAGRSNASSHRGLCSCAGELPAHHPLR